MLQIIFILLALPSLLAFSLAPSSGVMTRTMSTISMSGGRSQAEKGLSKRGMFLQLKQKLKSAAEIPGFFQVGEGEPDIELYCKSNKDGTQIGDCPFTQFLQVSKIVIIILLKYTYL